WGAGGAGRGPVAGGGRGAVASTFPRRAATWTRRSTTATRSRQGRASRGRRSWRSASPRPSFRPAPRRLWTSTRVSWWSWNDGARPHPQHATYGVRRPRRPRDTGPDHPRRHLGRAPVDRGRDRDE